MEAVTIIGAIAAIAIVVGISFVVDRYSWGTCDYRPFNPKTIWVSFVCGLLVAVGVYRDTVHGHARSATICESCR